MGLHFNAVHLPLWAVLCLSEKISKGVNLRIDDPACEAYLDEQSAQPVTFRIENSTGGPIWFYPDKACIGLSPSYRPISS